MKQEWSSRGAEISIPQYPLGKGFGIKCLQFDLTLRAIILGLDAFFPGTWAASCIYYHISLLKSSLVSLENEDCVYQNLSQDGVCIIKRMLQKVPWDNW